MEHVSLLKAKQDLSDEEEKDMLDYLYTTQYQMRGILAISLGEFYSKYLVDFGGFSLSDLHYYKGLYVLNRSYRTCL